MNNPQCQKEGLDVQIRQDGKKSDEINKERKSSIEMLEDEQLTVPERILDAQTREDGKKSDQIYKERKSSMENVGG